MDNRPHDQDHYYQLWWLIIHMRRAMYRARTKELFRYGITPEEAAVLFATNAIGFKATPAEISRMLLRQPHSISALINRMKGKGLVSKVKDLEKKNQVRVALTEKGQRAYEQSVKRDSIHRIMSSISEDECEHLAACLKLLRDKALEEAGITIKPVDHQR